MLLLDLESQQIKDMKKPSTSIVIGAISALCIITIFFFAQKRFEQNSSSTLPTPSPTQAMLPTLSPYPSQKEKEFQQNYAEDRKNFLTKKPWILKLPLKSDNYFISYDPGPDEFLATIYYLSSSATSKEQQLEIARQDAIKAIRNLGVDTAKQRIVFFETPK